MKVELGFRVRRMAEPEKKYIFYTKYWNSMSVHFGLLPVVDEHVLLQLGALGEPLLADLATVVTWMEKAQNWRF